MRSRVEKSVKSWETCEEAIVTVCKDQSWTGGS